MRHLIFIILIILFAIKKERSIKTEIYEPLQPRVNFRIEQTVHLVDGGYFLKTEVWQNEPPLLLVEDLASNGLDPDVKQVQYELAERFLNEYILKE